MQIETPPTPVFPPLSDAPTPIARRMEDEAIRTTPTPSVAAPPMAKVPAKINLLDLWTDAVTTAKAKLAPEAALTGASRELQAGLGALLATCHEHGVKVGPWRLTHVVPELSFGDHPTYGVLSLAHWAGKAGKTWRLGIGLFLGRGPGKPRPDGQTQCLRGGAVRPRSTGAAAAFRRHGDHGQEQDALG